MAFDFPETFSDFKDEIEQTDNDGTLQIYSYKHCDNKSDDVLKQCRGVIYEGDKQLVRSIGYTPEWSADEWTAALMGNVYSFYPSYEGTLIRMFYSDTKSKWYIATHRKLDAFRSRWGSSVSFGQMFEEALQNYQTSLATLYETLDKKNTYLFLLSSTPHTRMVCRSPETPFIIHVGTLLDGETYTTDVSIDGLNKPEPLPVTNDQVRDYVEAMDPLTYQGLIAFDKDGNSIKIVNSKYKVFAHARGNDPSVMFRYLKIRSNPAYSQLLFDLYPEHKARFIAHENLIYKIAKTIHTAYINRFVNKQQVVVSPEEYRIVKECHGYHLKDREKNKVTVAYVLSVLSMPEYTSTLNAIIKKSSAEKVSIV